MLDEISRVKNLKQENTAVNVEHLENRLIPTFPTSLIEGFHTNARCQ